MLKNLMCVWWKKKLSSLIFLEVVSLVICLAVGYASAELTMSERSLSGAIVACLFLSMTIVPFIHKRYF